LVSLLRDGEPVAMSTRAGEFVTMREVIDEVGADAARYNFLLRRCDSALDFDLELAKQHSNENPVYYVQYAHARICSIIKMAKERGIALPSWSEVATGTIILPEEIEIIKLLSSFPEVVAMSAHSLEPHRVAFFLNELAGLFHSYYNKHKIISEDRELMASKFFLIQMIKVVLKNGLSVLGVSAPERM
ncbi:MAG: DALR anticodon-binding domain-containing protein, partial [Deltaproteobacteria bacterium]